MQNGHVGRESLRGRIAEARERLEQDLVNGVFTPFLGAGASSLRPVAPDLQQLPWRRLAQTLAAIRALLNEKQEVRSIRYLQSFARERLEMCDDALEEYIPTSGRPDVADVLRGNRLVQLQAALVRASACLTHYFGEGFAEHTPSVHHLREAWVPFQARQKSAAAAIRALFDSADCARGLRRNPQDSPFLDSTLNLKRNLSPQRVYEKIVALILLLVPQDRFVFRKRFEPHKQELPEMFLQAPAPIERLRLDSVQWMSDLLWYTLRYWLPRYPTTAELAFELSLGVKYAPARRAELAQAAEALASRAKTRLEIRRIIDYCEGGPQRRGDLDREAAAFYYAIAAAVQYQFSQYKKTEDVSTNPVQRFKKKGELRLGSAVGRLPPIVFTTNFDRALENIFRKEDLPYHVVFPVEPGDGDDPFGSADESRDAAPKEKSYADVSRIVWILRSYHRREIAIEFDDEYSDEMWEERVPDGEEPDPPFAGPVFVKLHGSPSERRPRRSDHHWLVLSEGGYLEALSGKYGVPTWLGDQLNASTAHGKRSKQHRSVWFLGYSLSDWNVRLHLYHQCREVPEGSRSTVNPDDDIYRVAILDNLGVRQWVGDLNRLPSMIESVLADNEIPTDQDVDRLVMRLREYIRGG